MKEVDAFGKGVLAYLNKQDSFEIIERDDGYIYPSGGHQFYFAEFKEWPLMERKAIKFVKGTVLDVGCGVGRVALYLQQKGYSVQSIDSSPLAVAVCKKRGVKDACVMSVTDVHTLPSRSIQTVMLFGGNFGLLGSFERARKILRSFCRITTDNALIIASSNDPYKTSDTEDLKYYRLNKKQNKMPGQLRIRVRFKHYVGAWFDWLRVSKKEMNQIVQGTGWRIKKTIDSDDSRYMVVLERDFD